MIKIKAIYEKKANEEMNELFGDYGYDATNKFIATIPEEATLSDCFEAFCEALKHQGYSEKSLEGILDVVYDFLNKESEDEE